MTAAGQARPLFVTGAARSGTTLLSQMLSAHPAVHVANDPYLPLFRSLRNALIQASQPAAAFDPALPFQDYYFSAERLRWLDLVQAGDLTTPFERAQWPALRAALQARGQTECPDLAPYLDSLCGPTYAALLTQGLEIIQHARPRAGRQWVGLKEVWIVECLAALARAYPAARFIVLLRDPRAVLASMQALAAGDPTQQGQPLSYARHWRKEIALALHYLADPLFHGRLRVLTYEQLVVRPETTARALCEFLDVDFDPALLGAAGFHNPVTGRPWTGNSSYDPVLTGISPRQAERWRQQLPPAAVDLVEFICGPDMRLAGYAPETDPAAPPRPGLLADLWAGGQGRYSWRSDLGDPQQDYGFELFRRALLAAAPEPPDPDLIRRSFLFPEVYARLRDPHGPALFTVNPHA